jgi:hypothetical protein
MSGRLAIFRFCLRPRGREERRFFIIAIKEYRNKKNSWEFIQLIKLYKIK